MKGKLSSLPDRFEVRHAGNWRLDDRGYDLFCAYLHCFPTPVIPEHAGFTHILCCFYGFLFFFRIKVTL